VKRNVSIVDFVTDPQLRAVDFTATGNGLYQRETKIYDGRQELFVGQRETRFLA